MKIKLSKALKLKNKLAGDLNRLQAILARENVRREHSTVKIDRKEVFDSINLTRQKLIKVKTAIAKANIEIYEYIFTMAERKAEIAFLSNLNVQHGEFLEVLGMAREPIKVRYDAFLQRHDVDKRISELEAEIEVLQDKIDEFNATTLIEVDLEVDK